MQADPGSAPDRISAWYRAHQGAVLAFHHRHGGDYAVEPENAQAFICCLHGVGPATYCHLHRN